MLGFPGKPLASDEARQVISNAKRAFVTDNPRAWWLNLKGATQIYDSKTNQLNDVLPSNDKSYWFIPEIEEDDLPVFDLTLEEIQGVLDECPFFEYYVLNKLNRWLVAESDHDQFYVCRSGNIE